MVSTCLGMSPGPGEDSREDRRGFFPGGESLFFSLPSSSPSSDLSDSSPASSSSFPALASALLASLPFLSALRSTRSPPSFSSAPLVSSFASERDDGVGAACLASSAFASAAFFFSSSLAFFAARAASFRAFCSLISAWLFRATMTGFRMCTKLMATRLRNHIGSPRWPCWKTIMRYDFSRHWFMNDISCLDCANEMACSARDTRFPFGRKFEHMRIAAAAKPRSPLRTKEMSTGQYPSPVILLCCPTQ
mmetsp:Transcript_27883/g.54303  ORF Transcript_27883/g.54303 Transcript_27883/m.54303 type:complete len:249 (-) Transcript_27883:4858-5604(-)